MSERYSCIENQLPWKVHFEIMKHFYCLERMFIARSHEYSPLVSYFISDISRWDSSEPLEPNYKELQEPNLVFSDEAAVPRLDTLTTKVGKSTLVQ